MEFAFTFLKLFFLGLSLAAPLLLLLLLIIIAVGQLVGYRESWSKLDALYWSLVTATTLGYGDFIPARTATKLYAIFIALTGIIFTGILVALALHAATVAFKKHHAVDTVKVEIHQQLN